MSKNIKYRWHRYYILTCGANILPALEAHSTTPSIADSSGKGQILCIFRFRSPVLVLRVTTRTTPSDPGRNSDTLPSKHWPGVALSSAMKTRLPIWTLLAIILHFERSCIKVRFWVFKRRQNKWCTTKILFQWSAMVWPMLRHWVGDQPKSDLELESFGSDDKGYSGIEFITASTCVTAVERSS